MDEDKTITLRLLRNDVEIKKLVELYKSTTLYHHSRIWQGKSYPMFIQISSKGLDLYYLSTMMFKGWFETDINNNEDISLNIVTPFVEEAKAVVRNFYAKIDFLTS